MSYLHLVLKTMDFPKGKMAQNSSENSPGVSPWCLLHVAGNVVQEPRPCRK